MSIPNYPKIETVDGEIKHDPDDDAAYMLEVVNYLYDEVASMRNSDNLTNDEIKATIDASEHLARLRGQLEERAQKERIEDIPFEKINENLDSIMSSTVLIQHKLADVHQKIDRVGWPETNPYDIAGEQEHAAKDVHQDIARLQREIEEEEDDISEFL